MATIKKFVQTGSKTTPVTANSKNCIIQTVPLTDAADTAFTFIVNNKQFYPEQNVQLTPVYGGLGVPYVTLASQQIAPFQFAVRVHNLGTVALNAPLQINVSVIQS
jgi:hypothetical protein